MPVSQCPETHVEQALDQSQAASSQSKAIRERPPRAVSQRLTTRALDRFLRGHRELLSHAVGELL